MPRQTAGRKPALRRALAILLLASQATVAQSLDDRHLPVIPRTPEEMAKVAAELAPVIDFAVPETFEANPAGAATVRATGTADAF